MTSPATPLAGHLAETAAAFRLGMEGEANERFTLLVDALEKSLQSAPAQKLGRLASLLPEIFAAQQRQDYLNIADLLEYRLGPLLGQD